MNPRNKNQINSLVNLISNYDFINHIYYNFYII